MSRPAELSSYRRADRIALAERGYRRCEHCGKLFPVGVSRCRRRICPGYAPIWARDTMRKIRENLRTYGGLACMCTVTAPGEAAGLVWDRPRCAHAPGEDCDGRKGCRVVKEAAEAWNEHSRGWWRELNRVCKLRADRAIRRLGYERKGGLLLYEWELQRRGVWHLHFVLGVETAIERVWAIEYLRAIRELAPAKGFGFVDSKPLHHPERAEQVARYLSKYLAKWNPDGTMEITQTVTSAGRTLLNYVSRTLTAKSGVTMRTLRDVRIAWAWIQGYLPDNVLDPFDLVHAVCLLEQFRPSSRAP
jgi:hypothetical protein